MNDHLRRHLIVYVMMLIGMGNAFIAQYRDLTAAQEAAMTRLNWAVSVMQFLVAGAVVAVGYMKRPQSAEDDDTVAAPPLPKPGSGVAAQISPAQGGPTS